MVRILIKIKEELKTFNINFVSKLSSTFQFNIIISLLTGAENMRTRQIAYMFHFSLN